MRLPLILAAAVFAQAPDAAMATTKDSCLAEVRSVLLSARSAGPHRIEVIRPGDEIVAVHEIVPDKGFHAATTNTTGLMEVTVLGEQGWMKTDGRWEALPPELISQTRALWGGPNPATISFITRAECHGLLEADDQTFFGYRFGVGDSTSGAESILYADPKTKLPIGVVELEHGEYAGFRRYTYDSTIVLAPPV